MSASDSSESTTSAAVAASQLQEVEEERRLADFVFYYLREPFRLEFVGSLLFGSGRNERTGEVEGGGGLVANVIARVPLLGTPLASLIRGYWEMVGKFYFSTSAS